MKSLKIKYVEVDDSFEHKNKYNNIVYLALSKYFDVHIVQEKPDVIVSNALGITHLQYDTPKIILSGENGLFHPDQADIYISFKLNKGLGHKNINRYTDKYFNYVHAMEYEGYDDLVRHNKRHAIYTPNPDKFCAFLYSNNTAKVRKIFCKQLMKYKPVDCLGAVLRNTEHIMPKYDSETKHDWPIEQLHIYNQYKFTIAFENMFTTDSITEKILQPLLVGSIPIYWGTKNIKQYFNPDCFINVNDFTSFAECIKYIQKVDNDPELYQKYLNAPPVLPTSKLHDITVDTLADWLYPRVTELLNHPEKRIGKFDEKQQKKLQRWQRKTWILGLIRTIFIHNTPMPLYKKITYNLLYSPPTIIRHLRRGICTRIKRLIKRITFS